ncbi:MAG: hypothetical protein IJX05_04740, partial [Clostridia bacterium]|nr:hypothetical protein [Clostridia bacterium]
MNNRRKAKVNPCIRSIAMILALIMAAFFVPFALFEPSKTMPIATVNATTTNEDVNFGEDPTQLIGFGYNALSGKSLDDTSWKVSNWLDADEAKVYYDNSDGVKSQRAEGKYMSSMTELMKSFGIDYSNSASVDLTMKKIKVGFERKFSLGFDYNTKTTHKEIYYTYNFKAICEEYFLGSDIMDENIYTDSFLNAVSNIDVSNESSIEQFFDRFGTHMLTGFNKGGELTLSAWAIDIGEEKSWNVDLDTSASGNVGVSVGKKAEVSATTSIGLKAQFNNARKQEEFESGAVVSAIGGNTVSVSAFTNDADTENVEVDYLIGSLNNSTSAFLPDTTQWLPIWEALPARFENVREPLKDYFIKNATDVNEEFLKKYCNFTNRFSVGDYTYISPTGYVFNDIPMSATEKNPIAPGSTVILSKEIDSTIDVDSISYKVSDERVKNLVTFDRNGVMRVSDTISQMQEGTTINVEILSSGIIMKTIPFEISFEGGGINAAGTTNFAGGFGTEKIPYLIGTADHVNNMKNFTDKNFLFISDIDMGGRALEGIPVLDGGILDGNGFCLYNFDTYVRFEGHADISLVLLNKGTIKNLTVGTNELELEKYKPSWRDHYYSSRIDVESTKSKTEDKDHPINVGGICAVNEAAGKILNCKVENTNILGAWITGGSSNQIDLYMNVGGICGKNKGEIDSCSVIDSFISGHVNNGHEKDSITEVGGIVGYQEAGVVSNCYSDNDTINAYANVHDTWANDGVDGHCRVGGIVGRYDGGNIKSCLNDTDIDNIINGGGKSGNAKYHVEKGCIVGSNNTSNAFEK